MEGDLHAIRIGRNEATLRRVNEALEPAGADPDESITFVCECGQLGCTEQLVLTRAEYADVRTSLERFMLVPGHEDADVERVVEHHDGYVVVAKHGLAAEVAANDASDPRDDLAKGR